jgi:hypothetical protein
MSMVVFLIALASGVPTIDIESTCRSARTAALPEDQSAAYDSCMRDERDAKEQLRRNWTKYSPDAHAACTEEGGLSPSYVEWLTCLEMQPGGSLSIQGSGQDVHRKLP